MRKNIGQCQIRIGICEHGTSKRSFEIHPDGNERKRGDSYDQWLFN